MIGNNLFKDGDIYTLGLRYADTLSYDAYTLDLNARYPVTRDLRLSPRMRFRYRDRKESDLIEYAFLPSLRMNYRFQRNHNFELEFGGEWLNQKQDGEWDRSLDYFVAVGYRFDF